jgi:hypothetical protein
VKKETATTMVVDKETMTDSLCKGSDSLNTQA